MSIWTNILTVPALSESSTIGDVSASRVLACVCVSACTRVVNRKPVLRIPLFLAWLDLHDMHRIGINTAWDRFLPLGHPRLLHLCSISYIIAAERNNRRTRRPWSRSPRSDSRNPTTVIIEGNGEKQRATLPPLSYGDSRCRYPLFAIHPWDLIISERLWAGRKSVNDMHHTSTFWNDWWRRTDKLNSVHEIRLSVLTEEDRWLDTSSTRSGNVFIYHFATPMAGQPGSIEPTFSLYRYVGTIPSDLEGDVIIAFYFFH